MVEKARLGLVKGEKMLRWIIQHAPFGLVDYYRARLMCNYEKLRKAIVKSDPEIFDALSTRYVLSIFKMCRQRVPAYREFLSHFNTEINTKDEFDRIPATDKKNYILNSKSLSSLCLDGKIRGVNLWVKSSGHSGKEREWAKGNDEINKCSVLLAAGLDAIFDFSKTTLVINGYILGSWVSGVSFALMLHEKNSIINIGPHEDEILDAISTIGSEYEQIIILGYPPFVKHLVDQSVAKEFKWENYNVHFFVGGEFFSEGWRTYIEEKLSLHAKYNGKIIGGYGSSDFGIIGGIETDDTIRIRRLARSNDALHQEIFGDSRNLPMFFQYSPFLHIHADNSKNLHITTLLPETIMPLVNYNIEDVGGVISYNEMKAILKKHHIDLDFKLKFPFMFVEGRNTGALKLCAFMIYPENIKQCIYRAKDIAHTTTSKFKMRLEYDKNKNEMFIIDFELTKGVRKTARLTDTYSREIQNELRKVNRGYDSVVRNIPEYSKIHVRLYEFGKFPHKHKIKYHYI